jgi:UDP-3-O-[3-hydroxymyristoyl] glucosamine N-acyltransferase
VGVAGHLTIGDYSMVGAQSGVSSDLAPKGKYFGTPTREAQKMKRIMAVENNLPEMYKFVNQLKRDKERE